MFDVEIGKSAVNVGANLFSCVGSSKDSDNRYLRLRLPLRASIISR